MVIGFPTVDFGGVPSAKGGVPEGGGPAFAWLVEDLLAEEWASPADAEASLGSPNEQPPVDVPAVLFVVPAPVANVPALNAGASGDTDDLEAGPSDPSHEHTPNRLELTAVNTWTESGGSRVPADGVPDPHAAGVPDLHAAGMPDLHAGVSRAETETAPNAASNGETEASPMGAPTTGDISRAPRDPRPEVPAERPSPLSLPEAEGPRLRDAPGVRAGASEFPQRRALFATVPARSPRIVAQESAAVLRTWSENPPAPLLAARLSASSAPSAEVSSPSPPGVQVPESLYAAASAVPARGRVFEEEPEGPSSEPSAAAGRLVVTEVAPRRPVMAEVGLSRPVVTEAAPKRPVAASEDDRRPHTDTRGNIRGYVERLSASSAEAVPAQVDAVRRAGALAELGLDLGSPARDGSREGAKTASSQVAVPVMLTGTAATSTAVAPPQAMWMPASQADDVVLPQLVRAMRLQLVGGVGEARIQLDPEHLGAVTVNLRVEGGVVSAVVTAEQSTVRQWIENHETSLRQALAEQGLLLGKLHVERDGRPPGDRPSHGQDDTSRRRSPRKDTATFELLA